MDSIRTAPGILPVTRIYVWVMRIGLALVPAAAITYLHFFNDPALLFQNFRFHEVAISLAVALSAFISLVTWRCYRESGERFLFWLAQGLTGFTLIYLPHGVLTRMADHNHLLPMLYGPVSRIVMVGCLFIGLLRYGLPADSAERRRSPTLFWRGVAIFAIIDVAVAGLVHTSANYGVVLRAIAEGSTIGVAIGCVAIMLWRRISSPLMNLYLLAMMFIAQSSLAFLMGDPWGHLWWLAHLISAAGFFVLSYGVVEAFHTTRAFSTVYSQEEMVSRLKSANAELERLAATDALTGAANRRHFFKRAAEEQARAQRSNDPFALLMIDLDHFKHVNDDHGHPAGDAALIAFAIRTRGLLRAPDIFGRLGGEEFAVLLPSTPAAQAVVVAERIRLVMESNPIPVTGVQLRITVSIGVAEYGPDGDTVTALIRCADGRLYRAKESGRNCVVSRPPDTVSSQSSPELTKSE